MVSTLFWDMVFKVLDLLTFLLVNVDMGKVLVGIQVPPEDNDAFASFLEKLNYYYVEETDNVVYKTFLQ